MAIRVFVIDDDHAIRIAFRWFLKKRGYEVFVFSHSAICTRCHCSEEYICTDIIIADVRMPGQTGIEFIENRRMKGCQVESMALMSGNWLESDLQIAREQGCHIFHKPLDITEMSKWLRECEEKINSNRSQSPRFKEAI